MTNTFEFFLFADTCFKQGEFEKVDKWLANELNKNPKDPELVIGLLTSTLPGKNNLDKNLRNKICDHLVELLKEIREEEQIDRILQNLR